MSWRAQGMRTWLLQRLTAMYMLLFAISCFIYLSLHRPITFTAWHEFFSLPTVAIATILFFLSLLYHAWVGVRDIMVDYIHDTAIRFTLWVLITLLLLGMAIWVFFILLQVVEL